MAFTDILGQYVDNRLQGIQNQYSNATDLLSGDTNAWSNRLGLMDDEEERKRKERERLAQEAADREVQTQTIKTYQDGSQEHITKTQVAAPVSPEQVVQQQVQPAQQPAPQPEPQMSMAQREAQAIQQQQAAAQPQPVAPQPTVNVEVQQAKAAEPVARPVNPVEQAQQPLPQAGPPVQVASTQAGAGVAEAAKAAQTTAQAAAPAAAPSVAAIGAQAQAGMMTPEERQQAAIVAAHNETDPVKRRQMFAQVLGASETTEGNRALANKYIAEDYIKQRKFKDAEDQIASATPTELARYMKEQKKEGSYVKAILLARLGLTDLAKREQELINPELKMETAVVGKDKYTVVRNPQGGVEQAFDIEGNRVGQEQLAKISAAALPTKAHLLPSVHGTPVVKEVNGQQVGGLRMYDPQTQSSYVQVGDQRLPDTGWVTPGQAPGAVYEAAGARKQGEQAAETGQGQGVLPARTPAQIDSARRAEGDVAALDREIKSTKPTETNRLAILNQERAAAQQRLQQAGGPVTAGTGGVPVTGGAGAQMPGESYAAYKERLKREGAVSTAAAESNIKLNQEERSNFLTYEEKEIVPKADAGGSISQTRKSQLKGPDGILANPEIVGMLSGQGGAAAEVSNIIRDLVTGARTDDELSQRVSSLGLTQRQKDVLYNQIQLNRQIAPKTLKENAGAGSVSDAEQKANRDAAINITRVPLYTAVTMLSKDQFDKDQQVARQAFREAHPELSTVRSFSGAWNKEKARLDNEYNQIYAARAQYIAKYYNDGQNPGAIVDAYKYYPVPEFNRQTGQWDYGTEYSRKAARPKISSFER